MDFPIPKTGDVAIEGGVLVGHNRDGETVALAYLGGDENGNDYLCFPNEVTVVQRDDPPAVRLCTVGEQGRYCMGKFSFNIWRRGAQREGAMLLASNAEDVGGETGQYAMYTAGVGQEEPRKRLVISDAYADRDGKPRRTRVLMDNPQDGLKEFA